MSSNALLCWPNRADEATLTGGSWGDTLDNLKSRFPRKKAVSADASAASMTFTATFAQDRFVRVVALSNHSLSVTATVVITMRDADGVVLAQVERDVWPTMFLPDQLEWEYDNWWDGKVDPEDIEGLPRQMVHVLDAAVFCRSVEVALTDNAPASIGRLILAPQWQPVINISYGAQIGWEDYSTVKEALSGAEHYNKRRKARVAVFRLDFMDSDEGTNMALGMTGRLGVTGEVFFVMDPSDPLLLMQRSFNGRMRTLSPLELPAYGITGMGFEIKEVV